MIAIIDYDAGNIKSVEKALHYLGEETTVTRDPQTLLNADKVILPGVGSFGQAMENLHTYGLVPVIHEIVEKKTPFLGICLGLQLLFESSEETPGVEGLGILKGKIVKIPPAPGIKIPHMGWNSLHFQSGPHMLHTCQGESLGIGHGPQGGGNLYFIQEQIGQGVHNPSDMYHRHSIDTRLIEFFGGLERFSRRPDHGRGDDAGLLHRLFGFCQKAVGALSAALVMTRHTDESQSRFAVHRIILSSSTHGH